MKRYLFIALAVAGVFAGAGLLFASVTHDHSQEKNAFTPDTIPWGPAPPIVRPGAQFAVLEGDPTASSGDFTIRLKMPDGFRISPHWHPQRENVTVISGTFKVGMGDEFESDKMKGFTAARASLAGRKYPGSGQRFLGLIQVSTLLKKPPAMLRVDSKKLQSTGELRMCVTGWRKRYQFLVLREPSIAAAVLSCVVFAPTQSYSECTANQEECV